MNAKKPHKVHKLLPVVAAIGMIVLAAVIAIATVIGNVYANKYAGLISVYFNQPTSKVVSAKGESSQYFSSDYKNEEERTQALENLGTDIVREGAVLLENEQQTLPLQKNAKITVLGQDSADPVYGGGGAGSIDTEKAVSLTSALEDTGFSLNPTLVDFYTTGEGKNYRKSATDAYGRGEFAVNEVPVDKYNSAIIDSFSDYNDAAIVVIGRSGSESSDLPTKPLSTGATYLQLDPNERDTIKLAAKHFNKVVVLLNTQNPMEISELKALGANAVLWIGALGQTGARAVGELLNGTVNPSGHLPDTYATNLMSAPSAANSGSYQISNGSDRFSSSYMVYAEGIYVGYRYYETRYEDVVLGNDTSGKFDYSKQVTYPFGYGLSYTSFDWSKYDLNARSDSIEYNVNVTNTGKVAGKDVVQIYMQSPYTDYDRQNGIEKPSVELVGYEKTKLLQPGESQKVTVSVPKEAMKVYDSAGHGTYIVEAGDYYFTAARNAHDAVNSVLAAKGSSTGNGMDVDGVAEAAQSHKINTTDTTTYAKSQATGNPITNQFTDADIRTYDPDFTYLSRSDWQGTWPSTYADGTWQAPQVFADALAVDTTQPKASEKPIVGSENSEYGKLSVATLRDTDFNDEAWQALVEQMSVKELDQLVRIGGYATKAVDSVQLPATVDKDGPAGISSTLVGGESGMGYPTQIVIASSWNKQLAEDFGKAIGEDSLDLGVTVWYAPACNIHRMPYGGRAFEYFSEDALLSGDMTAQVVSGAASKGVIATVKHFALNDQETNRMGGAMLANEQSIRQLYLAPFEIAVREGGASAMMASMNRIGARWTGGHKGLMKNTLRDEWGFKGFVVTDQASYSVFAYEDMREGLAAGTDLWLNTDAELWKLSEADMNDDVVAQMQRAAKNISYAISRSNAMNGLSSDSKIVRVTPLWQWGVYAFDGMIAVVVCALLGFAVLNLVRRRKTAGAVVVNAGEQNMQSESGELSALGETKTE